MQPIRVRRIPSAMFQTFVGVQMLLLSTGCFHFRTELPGVLDLRSDASLAAPQHEETPLDESLHREGSRSTLQGAGVSIEGHRVLVHDRHIWIGATFLAPGAFLLWNGDGAEPELKAALGDQGILRNVQLSHRLGFLDFLLDLGTRFTQLVLCSPILVFAPIGPPMSFWASGERVTDEAAPPVRLEQADPVPSEPGADPPAEALLPPDDSAPEVSPAAESSDEEGPISL